MQPNHFQLHSSAADKPGDLGFVLLGQARQEAGRLVKVWLRRKEGLGRSVWTRYLDPRAQSNTWEVRLHEERGTGAMTRVAFTLADLDRLALHYDFPQNPPGAAALRDLADPDPIYARLRAWAVEVMQVPAPQPDPTAAPHDNLDPEAAACAEAAQGEGSSGDSLPL